MARAISKEIYMLTREPGFRKDWGLTDQMRRAAVSIMANIAEGFERNSRKEYVQFLSIAKASAGELRSHLYVARDLEYLSPESFDDLYEKLDHLSRMIGKHISYLKKDGKQND